VLLGCEEWDTLSKAPPNVISVPMPTVTFPLDYLQRLTATPPEMLAIQAFEYGLNATLKGQTLEVEVTAERPDLLAAEGFTRAINIYNGFTRTVPHPLPPSGRQVTVLPAVLPLRPHIAALVVRGADLKAGGLEVLVQFQEKVTQTFGRQRKKIAIGVYDLDQVEGNLTYGAELLDELSFVPLHHNQPMTARQILNTSPAGRSYRSAIPEGDRAPVLRDANGAVLSLPPIVNAAGGGEITAATCNLLIDVTGIVARSVLETANILAHNFLDTGAEVQTVDIVTPESKAITPDLVRRPVQFSAKYLNEIIGTAIPKSSLGNVLSRMDLDVSGTDVVHVPTYRTDVFSQVDVAGDLLVALGIGSLQAEPLAVKFHLGTADSLRQAMFRVGDLAQRMQLMEVKSFVLTDPAILDLFAAPYLQTGNAKSRTYSATRTTLQAGLLDILARNISAPKPINLYETGEVLQFTPGGEIRESQCWGFASLDARASFTTAKSYMQTMLRALGRGYELAVCKTPYYIPGRAATVLVEGKPVGEFGEIHPRVLERFSFPEPVCTGELNCSACLELGAFSKIEVNLS
jgi:phenylalanyl-tRNA synthetase beta chain